jgi:hypothetical protein
MVRTACAHLLLLAITGFACAAPGLAKDRPNKPMPSLTIEPIIAHNLLAPADTQAMHISQRLRLIDVEHAGLVEPPPYRLEREGDLVTGKRAKLSLAVGDTRVFAVSGKLSRRERPGPPGPLDGRRANALGPRKLESGRLYGGGLERAFGPVDLSAAYQYSRINGLQLDPTQNDAAMPIDNKNKSHSLLLNARLRF